MYTHAERGMVRPAGVNVEVLPDAAGRSESGLTANDRPLPGLRVSTGR
jgi:hypothetical protein